MKNGVLEVKEIQEKFFDVIIVGGGAAGTASAALLSEWGLKVLIIEKRGHLGGRSSTLNPTEGYYIDTGVHGLPYYDLGALKKIEEEVGITFDLIDYSPLLAFYHLEENISVEVFNFSNEGFKEVNRIWAPNNEFIQLLNYLRNATEEDANKLDSVSVKDFIERFSPSHQFYHLVRAINGMITIEPHLGSAGEFVRSFSKLFESKRPITYPREGGIQSLSEILGDVCKENSGKIMTSHSVSDILIEDDKVIGVQVKHIDKEKNVTEFQIKSRAIIVTIPLQFLFEIIETRYFSDDFVKKIENLKDKQSCAQGIAFTFKEDLLKDFPWDPKCWGGIVFPPEGKKPRYLSVPSALVENVAPPGEHYMFYGIVVTPEEITDRKVNKRRIRELKKELYQLFPRLRELKEWNFEGTSEMVLGTSKRVGITGEFKPHNMSADLEGLFFAGDTARGNGPGLECTYDSALKCSKIVLEWITEKKREEEEKRNKNVIK